MACLTVPLAEAIVLTVGKVVVNKINAKKVVKQGLEVPKLHIFGGKSGILLEMLYGGSLLLAAEHIYHGEITFIPPFLTALKSVEEIPVMLHEMATVGVTMAVLTTAVWAAGVGIAHLIKKAKAKKIVAA